MKTRWALVVPLLASIACGRGGEDARRAAEREDADRLAAALAHDPAAAPLRAVDDAVDDELPVRAAELLDAEGVPAARGAVDAVEAVEVRSEAGKAQKRALVAAYRARVAALEQTERALARGVADDLVLADAFRAQREVEERLLEARLGIEALREGTAAEDR